MNFFSISDREKIQDIFFAWLINQYDCEDKNLKLCSQEFIKMFIEENDDVKILSTNLQKSCNNKVVIDILCKIEINNKIKYLIIEDKVNAQINNNFEKYIECIKINYNIKDYNDIIIVCVKMGKITPYDYEQLKKYDYVKLIKKSDILNIFSKYTSISNDIFQDFYRSKFLTDYNSKPFIKWEHQDLHAFILQFTSNEYEIQCNNNIISFVFKDKFEAKVKCSSYYQNYEWKLYNINSENKYIKIVSENIKYSKRKGQTYFAKSKKNKDIINIENLKKMFNEYINELITIDKINE